MGNVILITEGAPVFSLVLLGKLAPDRGRQLMFRLERKGRADRIRGECQRKAAMATPGGFEPPISTVTGWHVRPLHHGAIPTQ